MLIAPVGRETPTATAASLFHSFVCLPPWHYVISGLRYQIIHSVWLFIDITHHSTIDTHPITSSAFHRPANNPLSNSLEEHVKQSRCPRRQLHLDLLRVGEELSLKQWWSTWADRYDITYLWRRCPVRPSFWRQHCAVIGSCSYQVSSPTRTV